MSVCHCCTQVFRKFAIHGKCFSFPSPFISLPPPPHPPTLLPSLLLSSSPHLPLLLSLPPFIPTPLSPTCKDFPSVNSVYRQQSPHTANSMDSLQREWFVFEHQLVLPEYIIHFQYSSTVRVNLALPSHLSCIPYPGPVALFPGSTHT